jgi:hypothetical protein
MNYIIDRHFHSPVLLVGRYCLSLVRALMRTSRRGFDSNTGHLQRDGGPAKLVVGRKTPWTL